MENIVDYDLIAGVKFVRESIRLRRWQLTPNEINYDIKSVSKTDQKRRVICIDTSDEFTHGREIFKKYESEFECITKMLDDLYTDGKYEDIIYFINHKDSLMTRNLFSDIDTRDYVTPYLIVRVTLNKYPVEIFKRVVEAIFSDRTISYHNSFNDIFYDILRKGWLFDYNTDFELIKFILWNHLDKDYNKHFINPNDKRKRYKFEDNLYTSCDVINADKIYKRGYNSLVWDLYGSNEKGGWVIDHIVPREYVLKALSLHDQDIIDRALKIFNKIDNLQILPTSLNIKFGSNVSYTDENGKIYYKSIRGGRSSPYKIDQHYKGVIKKYNKYIFEDF